MNRELCKLEKIPLWNYNSITIIQQHLIIMQYPHRHYQGINFVELSTSHHGQTWMSMTPTLDGYSGLWKILQIRFFGSGDKEIA